MKPSLSLFTIQKGLFFAHGVACRLRVSPVDILKSASPPRNVSSKRTLFSSCFFFSFSGAVFTTGSQPHRLDEQNDVGLQEHGVGRRDTIVKTCFFFTRSSVLSNVVDFWVVVPSGVGLVLSKATDCSFTSSYAVATRKKGRSFYQFRDTSQHNSNSSWSSFFLVLKQLLWCGAVFHIFSFIHVALVQLV